MDTLTRKQLIELAPGAAARDDHNRLLDTTKWLDTVAKYHFEPVFAMQGKTHDDSERDRKDGRHLVVAARKDGLAYALLNSHDRLMRISVGLGLWNGEDLLLAASRPLRRWKWLEDWTSLEFPDVERERDDRLVRTASIPKMAAAVAKGGYLGGRGRPSPASLIDAVGEQFGPKTAVSAMNAAFCMVGAARRGNLEPATKKQSRNVKGIRRPDAYQFLCLAAYKSALELSPQ